MRIKPNKKYICIKYPIDKHVNTKINKTLNLTTN